MSTRRSPRKSKTSAESEESDVSEEETTTKGKGQKRKRSTSASPKKTSGKGKGKGKSTSAKSTSEKGKTAAKGKGKGKGKSTSAKSTSEKGKTAAKGKGKGKGKAASETKSTRGRKSSTEGETKTGAKGKKSASSKSRSSSASPKKRSASSSAKAKKSTTATKKSSTKSPAQKKRKTTTAKYDVPKRGSIKRLFKSAFDMRVSEKVLNDIAQYMLRLTDVLVKRAHIYATHEKRVTILPRDVEAAAENLGINTSMYGVRGKSRVRGKDLELIIKKCDESELKKIKEGKRKVSRQFKQDEKESGRKVQESSYSSGMKKVLGVNWQDRDCITLQKAAFRKFVDQIMEKGGLEAERKSKSSEGKKKSSKTSRMRWSADAISLLQLLAERQVLTYAAAAVAIASVAKRRTVKERDFQASEFIGERINF